MGFAMRGFETAIRVEYRIQFEDHEQMSGVILSAATKLGPN